MARDDEAGQSRAGLFLSHPMQIDPAIDLDLSALQPERRTTIKARRPTCPMIG